MAPSGEALAVAGLLVLVFCGYLFRLQSVVISDMDEGTYLYASKLIAEGQVPYRDFFVTHPPLVFLLAGGWVRLFGSDIMPVRVAYMVLVLAGTVPLYLITRSVTRSRAAGLFSVAAYTAGMLLLANMGRTVRLEPVMNALLITAFAGYLLRPNSVKMRALVGVLLAAAVLVKVVAVIPAALLVAGDLLWVRRDRRGLQLWAATAAGGAAILIPAMLVLLRQPNFVEAVWRLQAERPALPLGTRWFYLRQDFVRDPAIPVALAAAAWFILRGRDARVRILSLTALGSTLALMFAFRTFFGYYLVQVLPWIAVVFAVVACAVGRRLVRGWTEPLLIAGAVVAGLFVPLLYGQWYYRTAHDHVSSPARIVADLRGDEGYLYTMYPSFALQSGRELYPWYYAADSLVPRFTGRIGADDFIRIFSGSRSLVLFPDELKDYPAAQAYVERHFRVAYGDAYWTLWVRSEAASTAP